MEFRSCGCLIFYLCIYIFFVEGLGGLTRAGSLNGFKSINKNNAEKKDEEALDAPNNANIGGNAKSSKSVSRSYISAWGIISLIMLVIVGSVFIYYLSIFYPLVCAKRGKYDVMEMTAV